MPQIGSKIAKNGVTIENCAPKSAKLDVFSNILDQKGGISKLSAGSPGEEGQGGGEEGQGGRNDG